jgi:hypothetical protein
VNCRAKIKRAIYFMHTYSARWYHGALAIQALDSLKTSKAQAFQAITQWIPALFTYIDIINLCLKACL